MEKFFKSDYFPFCLIALIFVLCIPFFWLHQGLLTIDTGRELYIPSQMLSGELLYRDILNIYGAFGYQINALLFKIFGERIETLYSFGLLNSFVIVFSVFFISREFFGKTISFFLGLLTIAVPVFTPYLFNTNLPYSYCFVYSLSSFLLSVLFLVKYEKTKNFKFSLLSSFFIGLSIASKLDFALFILVLVFVILKNKQSIKQLALNFLCFSVVPLISYGILLFQGVKISDFISTLAFIKSLSVGESFKIFYQNGLTLKSFVLRLLSVIIFGIIYLILKLRNKINPKNNWLNYPVDAVFIFILSVIFLIFWKFIFTAIPLLILILTLIFLRKIDSVKLILLLSLIAGAFKTMFYLDIEHFGAFLMPLFVLGLGIFCLNQKRQIIIILTALILVFAFDDCFWRNEKVFRLETQKGVFYTFKKEGLPIKRLIDFGKDNLSENDKILILPEGAFVNFALSHPSNSRLYSLIPLYVSMIGEQNIIRELDKDMPKYIVVSTLDTSEFGAKAFGSDYAVDVFKFIEENYVFVKSIDETSYKMNIYERKE